MKIDVTEFHLYNIIDSCSVWNILSSSRLYSACNDAKCSFCFTAFVEYECLLKPRKLITEIDLKLRELLRKERARGKFTKCNITIGDLQEIQLLENRKKLGMGELSSIAFAKKTSLAFLTDDKTARNFADKILGNKRVQTTPHLAGFLFYSRILVDSDLDLIIEQHNSSVAHKWGQLDEFLRSVYHESLRLRLLLGAK